MEDTMKLFDYLVKDDTIEEKKDRSIIHKLKTAISRFYSDKVYQDDISDRNENVNNIKIDDIKSDYKHKDQFNRKRVNFKEVFTVDEDNDLNVILFKDAIDYDKIIKLQRAYGNNPKILRGTRYLDNDRIECYIDNIAILNYHEITRENKIFTNFDKKEEKEFEFTKSQEDYIDKELDYRIKKNLDLTIIHELTHKLSGYTHPKNLMDLLGIDLTSEEPAKKFDYSNNKLSANGFDNQYAKKVLLERNIQTYTTKEFNETIRKVISWYSDRY